MRTNYSIKNSITSILLCIINILIGFISQTLFIKFLNIEYLGLSNVFINILSIIQIIEFGVGNLVIYYLYEPIEKKEFSKIKFLLSFYKKWCIKISIIFSILSLLLIPFLENIVSSTNIDSNIYIVYILFIISNIVYLFYNYNIIIMYVNQKKYLINIVHMIYLIVLNILQFILLYKTRNFYLYLIIKIIFQFIENIVVVYFNKKEYSYLYNMNIDNIDNKFIFKDFKVLVVHKVKEVLIYNTDNIVLSLYLGVSAVGLYSNYFVLVNYLNMLFAQVITSIGASIGNLLVFKDSKKNMDIYKKLKFLNFWIASFSGIILINVVEPFIKIWLGNEYILNNVILFSMVFCHFMRTIGCTNQSFYINSGMWRKDFLGPILETSVHLITSIICVRIFGIIGIIIAGILSNLVLWIYVYPKYVYKKLLKGKIKDYIKETVNYILLFIFIMIINQIISFYINISNIYFNLITNSLLSLILPNLILFIIYRKNEYFSYFLHLVKNLARSKNHLNK